MGKFQRDIIPLIWLSVGSIFLIGIVYGDVGEQAETFFVFVSYTMFGIYGGLKGKGSTIKDENAFGAQAGILRLSFGVILLLISFFAELGDKAFEEYEVMAIAAVQLIGISAPALAPAVIPPPKQ